MTLPDFISHYGALQICPRCGATIWQFIRSGTGRAKEGTFQPMAIVHGERHNCTQRVYTEQ